MPPTADYTLITADRVIDATGSAPIENGAVLIRGDRIVGVGRAVDVAAPEGAPAPPTTTPAVPSCPAWWIATRTTTASATVEPATS